MHKHLQTTSQFAKPLQAFPLKDKIKARTREPKNILACKNYYVLRVT